MKHRDFPKKAIVISGILLGIVICTTLCLGVAGASADSENGNTITSANIAAASKDRINDSDEPDRIKAVAAEQDISLECMDSEAVSAQDYCIDDIDTNTDKEQAYLDYLRKTLAETIKEEMGAADCEIDLGCADGEIISAQVSIAAEDGGADLSETDIVDYLSHALEIPVEDIILKFV